MIKRSIDLVFSSAALIALLPVFVVVAILIKLESRGPAFFLSTRIGKDGKPFNLIKFRTMVKDAASLSDVVSTPIDDPRITKLGNSLRKYCIDELPQLINVIRGEMSIIGPRPEVPQYVRLFTEEQLPILSIRPGLSDWATIWVGDKGARLRGSSDPEKNYVEEIRPEKMRLQLQYVRNRSVWIDFQIMGQTLALIARKALKRTPSDLT